MSKEFLENPNRVAGALKYDILNGRLKSAFDNFAELSPRAQQAILYRIAALKQDAQKRPAELLEEARVLANVYKALEDYLSVTPAEKRESALRGKPSEAHKREEGAEIQKILDEIGESLELRLTAEGRDRKTTDEKWDSASSRGRRGPQKPPYKDIERRTIRRPETM